MSVMSDRWIIQQSTPPTHHLSQDGRVIFAWENITHSSAELSALKLRGKAFNITPEAFIEDYPNWKPMIEPFIGEKVKVNAQGDRIASKGVTSYGYDVSAANEFKVFKGCSEDGRIDYKNITDDMFETVTTDSVWIPPNSFILARSAEYIRVPDDVLVLVIGKSTIARAGINCLCTPLEPGWEGYITLEFANSTNLPNRFYANEGCLQLIFLKGNERCLQSYSESGGKYQGQTAEIILPRV